MMKGRINAFFILEIKFYVIMKVTPFKKHLEKQYGKLGTPKREEFDKNSKAFAIKELSLKKELDFNTLNKKINGI